MTTKYLVPRSDNEGGLGKTTKKWHEVNAYNINGVSSSFQEIRVNSGGLLDENGSPLILDSIYITSAVINSSGELIITLSDDSTINAGYTLGPSGLQGETGPQGETGSQGPAGVGITFKGQVDNQSSLPADPSNGDAYITNDTKNLWIYNGQDWTDAGQIVGPKGEDGLDADNNLIITSLAADQDFQNSVADILNQNIPSIDEVLTSGNSTSQDLIINQIKSNSNQDFSISSSGSLTLYSADNKSAVLLGQNYFSINTGFTPDANSITTVSGTNSIITTLGVSSLITQKDTAKDGNNIYQNTTGTFGSNICLQTSSSSSFNHLTSQDYNFSLPEHKNFRILDANFSTKSTIEDLTFLNIKNYSTGTITNYYLSNSGSVATVTSSYGTNINSYDKSLTIQSNSGINIIGGDSVSSSYINLPYNHIYIKSQTNQKTFVGIGKLEPSATIHIKCTSAASGGGIRLERHNTADFWDIYNSSSNLYFRYNSNTAGGYLNYVTDVGAIDFTGQHRCKSLEEVIEEGMIVVSTGKYNNISDELEFNNPTINESIPIVKKADKRNDKRVFGVYAGIEDNAEGRSYQLGCFVSTFEVKDNINRAIINSLGEGGIWVCNINGNFENGDYITTCEIPGIGMKQEDDILRNYTVAKITQDCNFDINDVSYITREVIHEGVSYLMSFVGCTYHCG